MATTTDTARVSRRGFLRAAAVAAGAGLLAACANPAPTAAPGPGEVQETVAGPATAVPPTPAPQAAEKVTLDVLWQSWGEEYNVKMEAISAAFTEENPGIKVDWTFTEEWREKLLTRVAAGDPPDVGFSTYEAQAGLASQGAWQALDDQVAQAGYKREDFITSMWDQSLWEGKLYCIPGGADFWALFWDKQAYKEAGLDPEAPPKTTAELLDHSMKILKVDGSGNIEKLGYGAESWHYETWSFIFGGEWYDAAQKKATANHLKNVEALEWAADYVKEVGVEKLTTFQSSQPDQWSPGSAFLTGRAAYMMDGFWAASLIDETAPDLEYGVAFWPTLNGTPEERKNYVIQGWMAGLPSGIKHADASWRFVKYAFADNSWKMGCSTINGCTVISEMDQFNECVVGQLGQDNRMSPYFHVFPETGAAGTRYWPVIVAGKEYLDEVTRAYEAVVNGQKTAKQALDEVTELVQKELDKA